MFLKNHWKELKMGYRNLPHYLVDGGAVGAISKRRAKKLAKKMKGVMYVIAGRYRIYTQGYGPGIGHEELARFCAHPPYHNRYESWS